MLRSVDKGGLSDVVPVVSILTQEVCSLVVVDLPVRRFDATGGVEAVVGASGVVAARVACKAERCGGAGRVARCRYSIQGVSAVSGCLVLKRILARVITSASSAYWSRFPAYGLTL